MSKTEFARTLVTAALPYANGPVHIGHLAGVYLPSDVFVRYKRLKNEEVLFVCGSDEHGVPVTIRAKKEGISNQEAVDKYHKIIQDSFAGFGIEFDIYSRTSNQTHHQTASDFFKKMYDAGQFIEQVTEQYFDEKANQFLADRYIQGTCPICSFENAYGDQCENCGSTLSPSELKNPRSMLSGASPILKETKHWYLPLNQYEDWLKQWILEEHKEWKPNVYGQCKSWIDQGLQPRAVTRDLDWGVVLPVPNTEGKVLYVWFDAPIGYISATKDWAIREGKDWELWWKDKETRLLHFIGKDNIVFHCIIFPTMLHAHGEFIVPDNVPANEFLNLEGQKISTSRNWAVWLHEYLEDLPDRQDALRYTLLACAPETKDNDFTWKEFQARNNNELADIFGNFVNRSNVLTQKYFDGIIPNPGIFGDAETTLIQVLKEAPELVSSNLENFKFRQALTEMMIVARAGNKYLAETEPWKLIKTEPERVATILYLANQTSALLALLMEPFLPFSARILRNMLPEFQSNWPDGQSFEILKAGNRLGEAKILFTKITDEEVQKQLKKLENSKKENALEAYKPPAQKDNIDFEAFGKMDIRVATILEAEVVPKTKKLLKLKLDTGFDERIVVSGIAEYHKPEEIVGKQVLLLANLAPREIKGITSQGMILMAQDADGKLVFAEPGLSVKNGSQVS
jgi:methionyl-tRNA synthetase